MVQELELTTEQVIDLWFHHEEIAMHFNELIIQYRLQLLGGTGGLLALTSFIINTKVENEMSAARIRATASSVFLAIFVAATSLDIFYYNELLRGAVKAIIELEANYSNINMSTTIKNQFGATGATVYIVLVYAMILIPLFFATAFFWFKFLGIKIKNIFCC